MVTGHFFEKSAATTASPRTRSSICVVAVPVIEPAFDDLSQILFSSEPAREQALVRRVSQSLLLESHHHDDAQTDETGLRSHEVGQCRRDDHDHDPRPRSGPIALKQPQRRDEASKEASAEVAIGRVYNMLLT
jgi:hypothetical protein